MIQTLPLRNHHSASRHDDGLPVLRALIAEMGGMAEASLARALAVLRDHDRDGARAVIDGDRAIDAVERHIGEVVTALIVDRAPPADDLREILAAYRIAGLIERIGDYAKTVAKRTPGVDLPDAVEPMRLIKSLGDGVRDLLRRALDAFAARDAEAARAVYANDKGIDDLYDSLIAALLTRMTEQPELVPAYSHLLFIAKSLERVGDQATNIAELVYHTKTGEQLPDRHAAP